MPLSLSFSPYTNIFLFNLLLMNLMFSYKITYKKCRLKFVLRFRLSSSTESKNTYTDWPTQYFHYSIWHNWESYNLLNSWRKGMWTEIRNEKEISIYCRYTQYGYIHLNGGKNRTLLSRVDHWISFSFAMIYLRNVSPNRRNKITREVNLRHFSFV